METTIIKGNIISTPEFGKTEITENGYGVPLRERERLFYVFCGSCGARGGIGQSGPAANGLFVTEEQARSIAARKWNQRGGEMYADD